MNKNYSSFRIKLKTGFFKKESYFLVLGEQDIILRGESKRSSEDFKINKSVLQSVTISGEKPLDIEIITESDIFTGEFMSEKELADAAVKLKLFYGRKLYFY
jgi:hypothetical protein